MAKAGKTKVHAQPARAALKYRCLQVVKKKMADGTWVSQTCGKQLSHGGFRAHMKGHLEGTNVEWDISMLDTMAEPVHENGVEKRLERMERLLELVAAKVGVEITEGETSVASSGPASSNRDEHADSEEEEADAARLADEAAGDDDTSGERSDEEESTVNEQQDAGQEAPAAPPAAGEEERLPLPFQRNLPWPPQCCMRQPFLSAKTTIVSRVDRLAALAV